ncbi:tyrosine-type recombinase/integrase [Micromonospora ureilytica]|uniref:tyrosine-type recombinase/integrase n=1 Tax=Micromonospora ureilytica TaxID=709868 RepID=UPI002E109B80|nr:tyrosine-type recombinase/integrase [Micromonospora ureilytica]
MLSSNEACVSQDGYSTVPLLFTTTRRGAINRRTFDNKSWRPAVVAAGIAPTRATGMHALRHFYASSLLDAGERIKALASYLGHADPGFTLRVYTHLMPASEERTRQATDRLFDSGSGDADRHRESDRQDLVAGYRLLPGSLG